MPACPPLSARCVVAANVAIAVTTVPGQCLEECTVLVTLVGEAVGDQFGWKSNALGDLTGDGVTDFVVTAPGNDGGGVNAGRIYVYDGLTGDELWRHTSSIPGGRLGTDVYPAGDVDGDGVPDVIAGGPLAGAGHAVVLSGADGCVIHDLLGAAVGDRFGFRVAGGGDANGDGHPDLLVSATFHDTAAFNSGRVYLYDGAGGTLLGTFDGDTSADEFGTALAFIGDREGNGTDEIVVGAKQGGLTLGGEASVLTFSGSALVRQHLFPSPPGAIDFGHLFADGGRDIDADGVPDLYIGDFPANRAYVYSGVDFSTLHVLAGDGNGQFGLGEMIDDVDGDGHDDLFLAAWVSNAGGNQAGKTFVYSGADGSILETFTHDQPGANFGFDANGLGDVNADGRADYLVTAASAFNHRGEVFLIAGGIGFIGDLDADGSVGITDLLALLADWGDCAPPPDDCRGDLDGDGSVTIDDLLELLEHWR